MKRLACIAFALCAPVAYAHHGFGTFDMTKEIEITGTVTNLAFVNPHSWLYLDVTGADGTRVPMRCEMRSATTLRRSGWVPELFPVGGQVTIKGSPDRNERGLLRQHTGFRRRQLSRPVRPAHAARRRRNGPARGAACERQPEHRGPLGRGADRHGRSARRKWRTRAAQRGAGGRRQHRAPSTTGVVPLFSPAAASRLFIGRVPLTEAGQAAATAAAAQPNPSMRCEPIGILQDWSYDSPVNRITQDEKTIKLEYGKFDYARTIHLDQSAHPQNLEPSVTGHSIGRWENDVLIVHTVGVRAGPLTRGLRHSEALELTERSRSIRRRRRSPARTSRPTHCSFANRIPGRTSSSPRTCPTSPTLATIARC